MHGCKRMCKDMFVNVIDFESKEQMNMEKEYQQKEKKKMMTFETKK
jgi:hypothetical protein